MKCPNCGKDSAFHYMPANNEEGWSACDCCSVRPGEPPGFCPQFDRDGIVAKVESLLVCLDMQHFVSVSNSTYGDSIVSDVASDCKVIDKYDQYSICEMILHNMRGHGDYWKKMSEWIVAGVDPRRRCKCGKLASCFVGSDSFCREHWPSPV